MISSKITFSAFGDWGSATPSRDRVLQSLREMRYQLDFCVLLGDNFYPDGVRSVDDPRWKDDVVSQFPPSLRLYAILGNHDYHHNAHAQIQYTYHGETWKMPYYYYAEEFRMGSSYLQILFLDTTILAPTMTDELLRQCQVDEASREAFREHVRSHRAKQLKWLEQQLAKSHAQWRIVCGHYPLLSNGTHEVCPRFYESVFPILAQYGVHVYLAGHDHNAQLIESPQPGGHSIYCCVAGAVSATTEPRRRVPGTLFLSTHPGQWVCEVSESEMTMSYVDQDQKTRFQHTIPA